MITEKIILNRSGCVRLEDVRHLNISNLDAAELNSSLFTSLINIKSLDVSGNRLRSLKGIVLPKLTKLKCEDNMISDVQFLKNFPNLEELHITGNPLMHADRYIAVSILPKLKELDGKSCTVLRSMDEKVERRLCPLITTIWESQFANKLYEGMSETECADLEMQFCRQLRRSSLTCPEIPDKFRRYKIESIGTNIFQSALRQLSGVRQSPRNHTPKSYLNLTSPYRKQQNIQNFPSKLPTKRKLFANNNSPSKQMICYTKRKNNVSYIDQESEPNILRSPIRCTPKKTDIEMINKSAFNINYRPYCFLRCHSVQNDPEDSKTQVWKAAFEPDIISPGRTTNIVATCGGNIICLIDCQYGKIIKRYKHPNLTEELFTLDWTIITIGTNKTTILAAGGCNKEIHLLHPSQLVCYHSFKAHNKAVNFILFHSTQPSWLFSGGADKKIHLWDIGIPNCPDYNEKVNKLLTLEPDMEVIQLAFSSVHNLLFVSCDGGLLVWNIDKDLDKISRKGTPFESKCMYRNGKEEHLLFDGLNILSADCFAVKVANSSEVWICNMQEIIKQKLHPNQQLKFVYNAIYEWSNCKTDYISMGCCINNKNGFGLLASGDDSGQIWLYIVGLQSRKAIHLEKKSASSILLWPNLLSDQTDRYPVPSLDTKKVIWNLQIFHMLLNFSGIYGSYHQEILDCSFSQKFTINYIVIFKYN